MSRKMKYVMTKDGFPILFSEAQNHIEFRHFNPSSAGFCDVNYNDDTSFFEVDCYGESIGLKMGIDSKDKQYIEMLFNHY